MTYTCKNCGDELTETSIVCPNCGERVVTHWPPFIMQDDAPEPETEPQPKPLIRRGDKAVGFALSCIPAPVTILVERLLPNVGATAALLGYGLVIVAASSIQYRRPDVFAGMVRGLKLQLLVAALLMLGSIYTCFTTGPYSQRQ
ncbi:MAG TPA: hypothetical protein VGK19_05160 [Capsulimonadaceae bacterium]|jgi:hypothetical protein